MKNMHFLLILTVVFWASFGYAEFVHFKDGKVIEGEIIEQNDRTLKMYVDGALKRFYMKDIDRVAKDDVPDEPGATKLPSLLTTIDTSEYVDISYEKKKLILLYMEASGMKNHMETNLRGVLKGAPKDKKGQYKSLFDTTKIMGKLIPVYDKYFTEEELRQLVEFYDGPLRKKEIKVAPAIMQETSIKTLQYFTESLK
jgi:hypothetical protein